GRTGSSPRAHGREPRAAGPPGPRQRNGIHQPRAHPGRRPLPRPSCERKMTTATTSTLTVRGRVLRVDVRPGDPAWPPLLLCNGIGASLEVLQPFVDALDPRRQVIRFDLPGIGGAPRAAPPAAPGPPPPPPARAPAPPPRPTPP